MTNANLPSGTNALAYSSIPSASTAAAQSNAPPSLPNANVGMLAVFEIPIGSHNPAPRNTTRSNSNAAIRAKSRRINISPFGLASNASRLLYCARAAIVLGVSVTLPNVGFDKVIGAFWPIPVNVSGRELLGDIHRAAAEVGQHQRTRLLDYEIGIQPLNEVRQREWARHIATTRATGPGIEGFLGCLDEHSMLVLTFDFLPYVWPSAFMPMPTTAFANENFSFPSLTPGSEMPSPSFRCRLSPCNALMSCSRPSTLARVR